MNLKKSILTLIYLNFFFIPFNFEGYASSMALAKDDKNLIKCSISVAPTTDWLFYGKFN